MAPAVEIAIPSTSTSSTPKPYTIYTVTLRQPLRSWNLQKRYSDFITLHTSLTSQCSNTAPPASLPGKSWFKSTVSNPALTESRRKGLETYLQTINTIPDTRWRNSPAWRSFLSLPNTSANGKDGIDKGSAVAAAVEFATRSADLQAAITDPTVWLDVHRELKTHLRDARSLLTRRDQATTAQAQHEANTDAKRSIIRSGTIISALDRGLQTMSGAGENATSSKRGDAELLGDGELRRRKDLLAAARKERETLEKVLNTYTPRHGQDGNGSAAASSGDKQELFKGSQNPSGTTTGRRVLGAKETDKTRELDNVGVLQLQKQIMQEQDSDVTDLTKVVGRMKTMGVQINEELVLQNEMLKMVDQDVDRVGDKINIAKKRVGKIS